MLRDLLLVAAIFFTALLLVGVREHDRNLFSHVASVEAANDRLDVQWGQLLLEQGTFAAHTRVGKIARQDLAMTMPDSRQVVVVYTGGSAHVDRPR